MLVCVCVMFELYNIFCSTLLMLVSDSSSNPTDLMQDLNYCMLAFLWVS